MSHVKTVSAVLRKMFAVPEICSVLFEADSLQGLRMGGNVLDSHTRLQTILVKAGDNVGIAAGRLRASSTWRSDSAKTAAVAT